MRLSPFYTLSLFLYLFALAAPVSAQTSTGMIRGTVYDPSKAVIAGVKVTMNAIRLPTRRVSICLLRYFLATTN
jgi:hypothetical protein